MAALPPYAGVNRIRFGGSRAAAPLSTAHERSPGDRATLGALAREGKSVADRVARLGRRLSHGSRKKARAVAVPPSSGMVPARTEEKRMHPWRLSLLAGTAALSLAAVPALAQDGVTVAEARASLLGRWEGLYESLDRSAASEAFSWPVAVSIEDAGDGRTYIERQKFAGMDDDGALLVTVTILDPDGTTEHGAQFVIGTVPEPRSVSLTLAEARDATHWTLTGLADYRLDGEALQTRTTMVRDGDTLVTTLEIDPPGEEPPFGAIRRSLRRTGEP